MKVKCNFCKEYIDRDSAYRRGINYFCDEEHAQQAFFRLRNNTSKRQSAQGLDKSVRENVYKRDGFKCCYCGIGYNIHLHHVQYRSEGGPDTGDNLISLCNKHHELVHSNKKIYQALCHRMIYMRSLGNQTITLKDLEQEHGLES